MNNSKTYPRDVFLYLLSIITLVTVAISLGMLVYQYINIQFPDVLTEGYYWSRSAGFETVRNSMAVLIVVFPVFIWVSWFLRKDILKNPEKKELKIRRWLLYLTLFVTALVIIGDLVALLISFLNGELSNRFMLKVLTVLAIAGSIFAHYFSELREKQFSWMPVFDKVLIGLVAVSVVAGFWIAGSPSEQRAIRMDERRVSDLSSIQYQITDYWQRKQKLPQSLSELTNELTGFTLPKDPESGADYGYQQTGPLSFEICATFLVSNEDIYSDKELSAPLYVGGPEANWSHGEGMTCFQRKIDPDYYPPIKNGNVVPRPL